MAVFFGIKLRLDDSGSRSTLKCGDRDILSVSHSVAEEEFVGWRADLSIDPMTRPLPTVTKSQSSDVFLVLPKFYYGGGFVCDRIIVPDNQYVKIWSMERRILVDDRDYCDVMVLTARHDDMFCIIEHTGWIWALYVVLAGELYARRLTCSSQLEQVIAELEEKSESQQFKWYLKEGNFNNRYWREV